MPDSHAEWYTEDILRLPTDLLWNMSRQQSLFWGPQVFLILLVRKVLGWRLRPAYGLRRAVELPVVSERSVPEPILERFVPARRACQAAGLRPCFLTRPVCLGGRTVHAGVFLSDDCLIAAIVGLVQTRMGRALGEQMTFICESRIASGLKLLTQAVDQASIRHELVMPGLDLQPVSPTADPSQVIAAHRERLAERTDLIPFVREKLADVVLEESQQFFDWRVAKGLLVPLTAREVRRLSGS